MRENDFPTYKGHSVPQSDSRETKDQKLPIPLFGPHAFRTENIPRGKVADKEELESTKVSMSELQKILSWSRFGVRRESRFRTPLDMTDLDSFVSYFDRESLRGRSRHLKFD